MRFFNKNIKEYNEKFQLYIDSITEPKLKQEILTKLSTYCLSCANMDLKYYRDVDLDSYTVPQHCYEHTSFAIKYLEQILSIDETKRPLICRKLGTYYQGYIFFNPNIEKKSNGFELVQLSFKNEEKAIHFLDSAISSWNQNDNTAEVNYGLLCDQRVALCSDDDFDNRIDLYTKALTLDVKFYKAECRTMNLKEGESSYVV